MGDDEEDEHMKRATNADTFEKQETRIIFYVDVIHPEQNKMSIFNVEVCLGTVALGLSSSAYLTSMYVAAGLSYSRKFLS